MLEHHFGHLALQVEEARHAVDDLVVHAEAVEAGKVVRQPRRGPRTMRLRELRADRVELRGREARAHSGAHVRDGARDELSNALHAGEIGFGADGHVGER